MDNLQELQECRNHIIESIFITPKYHKPSGIIINTNRNEKFYFKFIYNETSIPSEINDNLRSMVVNCLKNDKFEEISAISNEFKNGFLIKQPIYHHEVGIIENYYFEIKFILILMMITLVELYYIL